MFSEGFGLEASWRELLLQEIGEEKLQGLRRFVQDEVSRGKEIYPAAIEIFNALNATPFSRVKVVILGQDPYHGPGQAHGFCFSVNPRMPLPPSLRNIYKELADDLGIEPAAHGCLLPWAEQGVLLLNAVLTVEAGRAGSHQNRGWEELTDAVVSLLNRKREHIVFLLWGKNARRKGALIDRQRHLVLESAHPSPLSASRGFFGNRHFSRTNAYLGRWDKSTVDWELPPRSRIEKRKI